MKKALQSIASGMGARLMLMLGLVLASLSASAATVEWKTFEIGTEYTAPAWTDEYYKYTASEDGIVTLVSTEGNMSMGGVTVHTSGDDSGVSGESISKFSYSTYTAADGTTYSQRTQFSVTAGQTYYMRVSSTFSTGKKFKGYLDGNVSNLTLQNSNFAEGETFDITDTRYGQLTLTFNLAAAAADSATISLDNGKKANVETRSGNSGSLSFALKPVLSQWLNDGTISGGEKLTFTITDVHAKADETIKYGSDGTYTMTFLCPSKPHQKIGQTLPSPFLSYWKKGNTNGIMVLEFDDDVAPIGQQTAIAFIRMGYAEQGAVYVEQFESEEDGAISVDGHKLLIDFTGKRRTYADMGMDTQWGSLTIGVQNVKMADGTNAYSDGNGTSGSYTFTASYEEVNNNLSFEWTPADGETLTDNNVKLYLSDNSLTFDAVKFNYQDVTTDKKYQEVVTEFTSTEEGTGIEYTIPFSDKVKNGKNVRVTLDGVSAADGYDHEEVTAKFNPGPELIDDFDPTAVSPKDGSTVSTLSKVTLTFDENVKLNTPSNAKQIVITDKTTGKNIPATIAVSESNAKQVVITPGEELKNTHKYEVAVGHAVISNEQYVTTEGKYGRFMKELDLTYTVYKASASFDFATDPLESSTLNELSSIKVYTPAGKSSTMYGISYTSNTEKRVWLEKKNGETYEEVAEAKVSSIDGSDGFFITFSPAITEPGQYNVVIGDSIYYVGEGNNAEPNDKEVRVPYTIIAAPTATIAPTEVAPASESTVESLKTITLTFGQAVYGVETPVTALNKATRQSVTGSINVSPANNRVAIVELDEEITAEGDWTVTIPQGVLGDQTWWDSDLLTGTVNAALDLYYTIGTASASDVVADPADGSTVTSIQTITLTWPNESEVGSGMTEEQATIVNEKGETVVSFGTERTEFGTEWNQMIVTLREAITADGTYTISFPTGFFGLGSTGSDSPAFTLTYVIGSSVEPVKDVVADPADGSVVEQIQTITLTWPNESEVGSGMTEEQATIVNEKGETVVSFGTERTEFGTEWNQMVVTLREAITADGVYTISFPAGFFGLGSTGSDSKAFTLTYAIGTGAGISGIASDATAVLGNVYTISGAIAKQNATKADLSGLANGIYVVNGQKILVK